MIHLPKAPSYELLDPEERPTCAHCGKRLVPNHIYRRGYGDSGLGKRIPSGRVYSYGYGFDNLFCTLRCGYHYAVDHVFAQRANP